MADRRISYLDRNFNEYKKSILNITKNYYNDIYDNLNDASIGSWFVDIYADIADNLSYYIDRVFQETSLSSAGSLKSIQAIARNNGIKLQGKKGAIVQVELSCVLPIGTADDRNLAMPDENYAPIIRRGSLFSTGSQTFELMEDVNFKEEFNHDGIANRQIIPNRNSNKEITSYTYKKLAIACAGQSKVYKKIITERDITPFMTVKIKDTNIMGVESVICKEGTDLLNNPETQEYFVEDTEYTDRYGINIERFFEVDNLVQQFVFGQEMEKSVQQINGKDVVVLNPKWEDIDEVITLDDGSRISLTNRKIAKGRWKRLKNKFTAEFDDDWNMDVTFGSGLRNQYGTIPSDEPEFMQYMMSKMSANDYMGVLPKSGSTLFIRYRVGGGAQSNIAPNTLKNIILLNADIDGNCEDPKDSFYKKNVLDSIKVTNNYTSYGGKDEPNEDELKNLIKYNNVSQNRCVTLSDYYVAINNIPYKYGCPFRCGVVEENNKIVIYTLGLDYMGKLSSPLSETVADNMKEYLSNYKMVNDLVEIRSGKIINVSFEINIFIDKSYNKSDVAKKVINEVISYMDIRRHNMGEDIFLGDLEKNISLLDGVVNLIELSCYNKTGDGYSSSEVMQPLVEVNDCQDHSFEELGENSDNKIDLRKSDKILFSDVNSMFEIKYPNKDIRVNIKQR